MSTNDAAAPGQEEPIDAEWAPADKRRTGRRTQTASHRTSNDGVGMGALIGVSVITAFLGAAMGAAATRVQSLAPLLDQVGPARGGVSLQAAMAPGSQLDQRIQALEKNVQTVQTASFAGSPDSIIALQQSVQALQGRIGDADVAAMQQQVSVIQQDINTIREQAASASQAARAAFAVAAAAEAARSSEPFEGALATLEGVLPGNADVAALAPFARSGAPSRQELKDEFRAIQNDIVTAARISNAGAGFWGRVQAFLAQFVVVRRTGEGATPAGYVERAGERLHNDDLAGAVAELSRLTGPAAQQAGPWMQKARARLEIDARLGAIRAELSRRG
jgi:hypothetical protein